VEINVPGKALEERIIRRGSEFFQSARGRSMFKRFIVLAIVACCTAGCASSGGYPDNPTDAAADLGALRIYFYPEIISQYFATPVGTSRKALRNEIIYARLAAYDIEYAKFQQAIYSERTLTDTTGDLTILVLSALGASLASTATKTALAASVTAVGGAKASIDKNLFYDRTLPALFAQMDANRAKALVGIEGCAADFDDRCPLTKAIVLLNAYREAGSLPGAVSGIALSAGIQRDNAMAQIQKIRGSRY